MKELINILSEEFKVQPSDKQVREWLNNERPFRKFGENAYYQECSANWEFLDKFMELGEQPLQLGYFVPCKNGEVLGLPYSIQNGYDTYDENGCIYEDVEEYQKAKESVIYEGFEISKSLKGEGYIYFKSIGITKSWDKKNNCYCYSGRFYKTISDMEGQPINKNFWTQLLGY